MKRKLALQEVAAARDDYNEQRIDMVELKSIIANVSELSGIGYNELLSLTAE